MALYLVLVSTILALSLTSTEHYVLSPGSNINLSLHSMKNASGHSITKVDTGRYTRKGNSQPLSVNFHQGMSNKTEQLDSVDIAHPSLHDTPMSGAVQPTAASTSTSTTITSTTPTTTTTPKSCPQSGYLPFPGFNCYKAFPGEMKNWSEARATCRADGGDLIVIESEREREDVYIPLRNSLYFYTFPWVGVYIPQGGNDWTTVKGEPALSTWWAPGEPDGYATRKCGEADAIGLLWNTYCTFPRSFICEISL